MEENSDKDGLLHVERFSRALLKKCEQRALDQDMTLREFVSRVLEVAVSDAVLNSDEMKTDKAQFDAVLSRMLRNPRRRRNRR